MSGNHKPPLQILQERVEKMKDELAQTEDLVADLKVKRDEDLEKHQQLVQQAKDNSDSAKKNQENALASAEALQRSGEALQRSGEALVSSGKKIQREAQQKREDAEALDLKLQPIHISETELRNCQKHWSAELARVQDGLTRRKRARLGRDIRKLEERMEKRSNRPGPSVGVVSVFPKDRGTHPPEEKVVEAKETQ